MEFQSILVATDFSDASERAVLFAAMLAKRAYGGRLHIVHTWHLSSYTDLNSDLARAQADDHHSRLHKLRDRVLAAESGLTINTHLEHGVAATEIIATATREGASLIVMGKTGQSLFADLVLGSVSLEVVKTATVPVVTVP